MKQMVSAIGLALCMAGAATGADETANLPLAKLFHKYDDYLAMAKKEEPAFSPVYQVFSKEGDLGELEMRFEHGGETISFRTDSRGFIAFRPSQALLDANPVVYMDRPKGTMGLNLSLSVIEPGRTSYDMKALHDKVHTAWGQAKGLGGILSVFAPKHNDISAVFGEACPEVTWSVEAGGKQIAGGTATGQIQIDFTEKTIRKADTLTFSCAPDQFLL